MIPPQALAAVPGWGAREPEPRVEPLAGGVLNRSFRVETRAGVFVLRLNGPPQQARALGVDRPAEIEAQRLAATIGLAPRVIAVAPDHAFQVCEFVAGEAADAARLATGPAIARLGATLQGLRTLAVPPALHGAALVERARRLVCLALERSSQVEAGAAADAGALHVALAAAETGWQAAGAGRRPCLVHSDPNPGNVLLVRGRRPAVLLDWEYAHRGDPLEDPAAWLHGCPALRGREAELLQACGLAGEADVAMLHGMAAVHAALDFAWCRVAAIAAGADPDGRAN